MLDRKQVSPVPLLPSPSPNANAVKQHRLMVAAFILLVIALVSVLYHDRDFWFPEQQLAQEQPEATDTARAPSTAAEPQTQTPAAMKRTHRRADPAPAPHIVEEPGPSITTVRTVLPPLDVEVVAGDSHRNLHPGTNSVQVDLQRGAAPSRARSAPAEEPQPAQVVKAAERVDVSANAADLVTHSVSPGYPTLARQMKVQGSVVLDAVIGRDGLIQELRIVSGPPILARAAQEAVRQWHFKPHYIGANPVETQAKITVNFTISTN